MAVGLPVNNASAAEFYVLDGFSDNGFILSSGRRLGVTSQGPRRMGLGSMTRQQICCPSLTGELIEARWTSVRLAVGTTLSLRRMI